MANNNLETTKRSGLKLKDYMAYGVADVGCNLVFGLGATFIQSYWTECLAFHPLFVMIILIVARIWDAINDPIMGRICDKHNSKRGKYKVWFLYGAIPLAISAILMFAIPSQRAGVAATWWQYLIATFTYILFGMAYTAVQIPYGSLASVVTLDQKERSKLSVWRTFGAVIGSLSIVGLSQIVYVTNTAEGDKKVMDWTRLIIGVSIMAALCIVMMILAYKFNKERVPVKQVPHEKGSTKKAVKRIFSNRAMLSMCIIGMLLLGGNLFQNSYYPYIVNKYFNQILNLPGVISQLPTFFGAVITVSFMFFIPKLAEKYGKKLICGIGMTIGSVANLAMIALLPLYNEQGILAMVVLFFLLNFISNIGTTMFSLQIWSMVADAIDDIQVRTKVREDGTSYAFFMFFRKLGQIVAAISVNVSLLAMNYIPGGAPKEWSENELKLMYILGGAIPGVFFAVCALLFFFWYPLNKKRMEELEIEKVKLYNEDFSKENK